MKLRLKVSKHYILKILYVQVYLDAVFNPLLREMDFHQEGWRLDFDKDKGDLAIKGVVFNEMKGAFADAQQVFGQKLLNSLLPSDTYGVCSGGLPEKIPDLTWEDLKQFHDVHYSPNNARFYSYGNLPLEQHLEAVQNYMPSSRSVDEKGKEVFEIMGAILHSRGPFTN